MPFGIGGKEGAQRGGNASMLRLRMSGGVMDLAKLKFIADAIKPIILRECI